MPAKSDLWSDLLSEEETAALTRAAQEALLSGHPERAEHYRYDGASVLGMARAVGATNNRDYAESLIQSNPQFLPQLATELALGFLIAGNLDMVCRLRDVYRANATIVNAEIQKHAKPPKGVPKGAPNYLCWKKAPTPELIVTPPTLPLQAQRPAAPLPAKLPVRKRHVTFNLPPERVDAPKTHMGK